MRLFMFLVHYLMFSVIASITLLIGSFPYHPGSPGGWLLLFLAGLPVTFAGEWISERVWHNPVARRIEKWSEGKAFSWLRLGYALVVMPVFVAAVVGVMSLFGIWAGR